MAQFKLTPQLARKMKLVARAAMMPSNSKLKFQPCKIYTSSYCGALISSLNRSFELNVEVGSGNGWPENASVLLYHHMQVALNPQFIDYRYVVASLCA